MKLLVIIVTYNAMPWTERCFDSLRKSTVVPDVFVVDNGSTDGTQAYLQKNFPEVMLHQSNGNLGFGRANNIGLQYALEYDYDYVYLLNQDAWVMPETFEKLIALSKQYPEYGILSPFQMNDDMYHIDKIFTECVCSWKNNPYIVADLYNNQIENIYSVPFVMAAHWFMTNACVRKVGGFSPTFSHYGEDNNYSDRVLFHGMQIGVVPSLRVVHDRGSRIVPIEKLLFFNCYIRFLQILSNPIPDSSNGFLHTLFYLVRYNLKKSIHYHSFLPIRYLFKILGSLRFIQKNRDITIHEDCAFLKVSVD